MTSSATPDLTGKTVLITGATEGIGKSAALSFARAGATLVLVGRNERKTQAVATELGRATGNAHIETIVGDLSKLADIRSVAAAFKARHDRLEKGVRDGPTAPGALADRGRRLAPRAAALTAPAGPVDRAIS